MTKYKAYEVLGIEEDALVDDIKAAYAELSKKYHPEENPEEFQQIDEAYTTLTRRSRHVNSSTMVEISSIEQTSHVEQHQRDLVFKGIQNVKEKVEEREQAAELSFEKSFREAQKQENEKVHQTPNKKIVDTASSLDFSILEVEISGEMPEKSKKRLQKVLKKLDRILPLLSKNSINSNELRPILVREKTEILLSRAFVKKLYLLLQDRDIEPEIYRMIVEKMRLWDEVLLLERKDLADLKKYLDERSAQFWTPERKRKDMITSIVVIIILGFAFIAIKFFY